MKGHFQYISFDNCWSVCIAAIFAIWFLASIIHQFRFKWWHTFARFDVFNLLPRWTFFAPNPGRTDLHLVFRSLTDSHPGPWIEVKSTRFNAWRWVWNPTRYSNKVISDLVNNLHQIMYANKNYPRAIIFSGPYISLLNIVMHQPVPDKTATHRQYAIVATQGFQEDRMIVIKYISEIHHVDH